MKKRILSLILIAVTLLSVSCGGSETDAGANSEIFTPLFRLSVPEGKEDMVQITALAKSNGFFYTVPNEEGGYLGAFVSPKRSVSAERVTESAGALAPALVREVDKDRAVFVNGDGANHLLLKESGAETVPYPDGFSVDLSRAVFFDDLTLLGETSELLVLCPLDWSEQYVLAQKERLPDFAQVLAVTHSKSRIWYATKEKDAFTGMAFFEYGSQVPLGTESFPFDSVTQVSESAILFTRLLEDGGALYLYRDLESGRALSLTVDEPFEAVTCDAGGTRLCGGKPSAGGSTVYAYDFEKGSLMGQYETVGKVFHSMAISADGDTLLFASGLNGQAVLATLDLAAL